MQQSFNDNWIYPTVEGIYITWRLSNSAEAKMAEKFSPIDFARSLNLSNVVVALSGGVDSQAACLLLKEAGILFTCVIMKFSSDFNLMDVSSAVTFCDNHHLTYRLIELDVLTFLTRKLSTYVQRYSCPSPQLTTHLWLYEQLGDATIISGGNAPFLIDGRWHFESTKSQSAWLNFKQTRLIGNFLGYAPDIALPLALLTPETTASDNIEKSRYSSKVEGLRRMGLDVTPQQQKFTGFENIKKYLEAETGDVLMFEKAFRFPQQAVIPELTSRLELSSSTALQLSTLHHQRQAEHRSQLDLQRP